MRRLVTSPCANRQLLSKLEIEQRQMFWTAIWDLANDPDKLRSDGIEAILGTAIYTSLRPGLIYVFKISSTGQRSSEVVPDI